MTDDTTFRLQSLLNSAGALAADALLRFRDGQMHEYLHLKLAFDAGRVTLGVDVCIYPEGLAHVWAEEIGGKRQVLVTVNALAKPTGSPLPS